MEPSAYLPSMRPLLRPLKHAWIGRKAERFDAISKGRKPLVRAA
jgi:hypothetical protein